MKQAMERVFDRLSVHRDLNVGKAKPLAMPSMLDNDFFRQPKVREFTPAGGW